MPAGMPGAGGRGTVTVPQTATAGLAPQVYSAPMLGWRRSNNSAVYARSRVIAPPTAQVQTFTTTFAATENPISESSAWQRLCPFFSSCQTAGGRVYGNQPQFVIVAPVALYEDAYAHLSGTWPANQRAEAIIDKQTTGGFEEYELHLLGTDGSDFVKCYEIYIHQSGAYFPITMWKGDPLSSAATASYFDTIADAGVVAAPQDGDLLWAQIVGNIVTAGINSSTYLTVDVTTGGRTRIPSGNPGIGFDAGGSGAETPTTNYGFKSFFATGL